MQEITGKPDEGDEGSRVLTQSPDSKKKRPQEEAEDNLFGLSRKIQTNAHYLRLNPYEERKTSFVCNVCLKYKQQKPQTPERQFLSSHSENIAIWVKYKELG